MTQEEGNSRDIDTFVQQLHCKSMPEAVEGNMLVDTGRLNQKRDFVIKNVRRKGREDGSFLPNWPQNGNCLLGKWYAGFVPSFLDSDTHIIAPLLSFQILHLRASRSARLRPQAISKRTAFLTSPSLNGASLIASISLLVSLSRLHV